MGQSIIHKDGVCMPEESHNHIWKIYNKITATKENYGRLRKVLFHLHTPRSYDFRLSNLWSVEKYIAASDDDIEHYCRINNVFPREFPIEHEGVPADDKGLFSTEKEWLSYMAIASKLVQENYELVVVTDHNCVGGAKRLERTIKNVCLYNANKPHTEVLYGIEISCADKFHVVGIYDNSKENELLTWLDECLISVSDGTYYTSLQVIDFLRNKLGAIAYIAHINSSDFFDGKKFLSGAYKKKLKDDQVFRLVGVHSLNQKESTEKRLLDFGITECNFVIDNDAHDCESLGDNYFWIKASKLTFDTIFEALNDFDVSVYYKNNRNEKSYIQGIYIEQDERGFLKGKDSPVFSMRFSDSLNCFIGGRGTGKSTVLQILDFALSCRVDDERMLDFLCRHGNVWVLLSSNGHQYIVEMLMPIIDGYDNILCLYGQNESNRYGYNYRFIPAQVSLYASKYQSIYEIQPAEKRITRLNDTKNKISQLFDSRYSINHLVQTASSNEINDFIYDLMLKNKNIVSAKKIITARSVSGVLNLLGRIQSALAERKEHIENEISKYNTTQKDLLRIIYSQNIRPREPDLEKWIIADCNPQNNYKNRNISNQQAVEYAFFVYNHEGICDFLRIALGQSGMDRYKYSIRDFLKKSENPNLDEQKEIIDSIWKDIANEKNLPNILEYLKYYVSNIEELSLSFNINSKTSSSDKANFKDVRELSLGQKVVAMLDFILSYGTYIGDDRPLLLDQPEDNLDSQYIYKNLVKQLREVKTKRQIIIATHNATIVTNSMTDQVCVMNSDGNHGWVEKTGYPSEPRIKKEIINYLEGGMDSFIHKQRIYARVLQEK